MRILRAAEYRTMAWKNGGGETAEIAVFPEGAGYDDFHWRLSMARIAVDGPFSKFPNVDRTLALIEGNGMVIEAGVRAPVALRTLYDPVPFPGEEATRCTLLEGPVTDLNMMVRRDRVSHLMQATELAADETAELPLGNKLVFCASGRVSASGGSDNYLLDRLDTLMLDWSDGTVRMTALEPAVLLVTDLYPAG